MKLVVMTKSTFFVEEDKILAALFDTGLECLHINKPGSSPMYAERLLTLLPEDTYRYIYVHDHYYLKNEYDLGGIHIDDPDMEVPQGYRGKLGRTCNELERLKELKRKSNFVFLRQDNATDKELQEASRHGLIDKKVYALGGITLSSIGRARDLGFGGVVVCSDLWNRFDIHSQTDYREVITYFEKLKKAVG